MPMIVALLAPLPPEALTANLPDGLDAEVRPLENRTQRGVRELVADADLVLGDWTGELTIDAEVVAAMGRARLYHQVNVGLDTVDVEALSIAGIPVTNPRGAAAVAMAEHSVMCALAVLKSLVWCDARMREDAWPQHDVLGRSLVELRGRRVGLVGLGDAGTQAASRFAAFGCEVVYAARRRRPPQVEVDLGVEWADLDDLLATSDVVVLLCALNEQTRGLMDHERIRSMKPGSVLINPSRGGLVDEGALVSALEDGHLLGAALDVFTAEPLPAESPLMGNDRVLLTPHVAGASLETRLAFVARAVEVTAAVACGQLPDGVLNGITALRSP